MPGVLQLGRRLRRLLHWVLREPRLVRYAAESQRNLHGRYAESVSVWSGLLPVCAWSGRWRRLLRVHLLIELEGTNRALGGAVGGASVERLSAWPLAVIAASGFLQ